MDKMNRTNKIIFASMSMLLIGVMVATSVSVRISNKNMEIREIKEQIAMGELHNYLTSIEYGMLAGFKNIGESNERLRLSHEKIMDGVDHNHSTIDNIERSIESLKIENPVRYYNYD